MLRSAYTAMSCCFIAVILASTCLSLPAKADSRLDLFIQKYEAMTDKNLPFAHPDSPFYPYLHKHFEEGLDAKDKAKLAHLQEKGNCGPIPVDGMLIKGFLQLYPFLKPAFEDEKNGLGIRSIIELEYAVPQIHCIAHQRLNKLRNRRNLMDFTPIDMAIEFDPGREYSWKGDPAEDWDTLFDIQFSFGNSAFCYDYPPAIKDIIATANRPGGMKLTQDEGLYLTERAHIHGLISNNEYSRAINQITAEAGQRDHFNNIINASKKLRMHEIEAIRGAWHKGCKELYNANMLAWR